MRKQTSMTLDQAVLEEARALGINLSQAAERGVLDAIRAERAKTWKAENARGIAAYNALIDAGGVPLSRHRKF